MLESSPPGWGEASEHCQILLKQAVRSLEAAYSAHQNILRAAKNPSTTRELLRSDISTVDIKFKQAFHSLSLLHIILYNQDCSIGDGMSIWKNFKVDSAVVSEKISAVETLVSEIKIDVPPSIVSSKAEIAVKLDDKAKVQSEVKVSSEETEVTPLVSFVSRESSPKVELSKLQTISPYAPAANLMRRLKNLRCVIEKRCEEHGFHVAIIQALHELEKYFHIPRDPTTSSLWNMDHQQQRKVKFEESNEQVVYRWKCECTYDDDTPVPSTADTDDHSDDAFCPRNIEKDEAEISKQFQSPSKKIKNRVNSPQGKRSKDPTTRAKAEAILQITLDHVGRQNIKHHFLLIRDLIRSEYRKPDPWVERQFGIVLSGPGNTGKIEAN